MRYSISKKCLSCPVLLLLLLCSTGCDSWSRKSVSSWEADLENTDPYVRMEAVAALSAKGTDGIPALTKALSNDLAMVRCEAAQALGHRGAEAAPAIPSLINLLQDNALDVKEASAEALGRIGPSAREAVPALQNACQFATKNRQEMLQRKIYEAVQKIEGQKPTDNQSIGGV